MYTCLSIASVYLSLLPYFSANKDYQMEVSPNHLPVIVASDRPRTTLSLYTCRLTKFQGVGLLNLLREADDDAFVWLESTATAALAK